MAKFEIPRFRYLTQDADGDVWCFTEKPFKIDNFYAFFSCKEIVFISGGEKNPNWRDTLIDLNKDDYEFEDGILRRIEK